jgi:hypothetical protein
MKKISTYAKVTLLITIVIILTVAAASVINYKNNKTSATSKETEARPLESLNVAPVWSVNETGQPVLYTTDKYQFVTYYDNDRNLSVAGRELTSNTWIINQLPVKTDWNTGQHHSIAFEIDKEGYLHVSAAMHGIPLIYYKSTSPYDVKSIVKVDSMVGSNEASVTYPVFIKDKTGELIFTYRDGVSGNGIQIYNKFDTKSAKWTRLMDKPLLDGLGSKSAYMYTNAPIKGSDGRFHLLFLWRDSADCVTCHDLSYMVSDDLVNWKTIDGKPVTLPVTPNNKEVVVDPVGIKSGLINLCWSIGFDNKNLPILTYHKYDSNNNSQLYNARFENGKWNTVQATNWNYKWNFGGIGAMVEDIKVEPAKVSTDGNLQLYYEHKKYGKNQFILDKTSLKAVKQWSELPSLWGNQLNNPETSFTARQMLVSWVKDIGNSAANNSVYYLRWEHGPNNNDKTVAQPWPDPSMLKLYRFNNKFVNSPKIIPVDWAALK